MKDQKILHILAAGVIGWFANALWTEQAERTTRLQDRTELEFSQVNDIRRTSILHLVQEDRRQRDQILDMARRIGRIEGRLDSQ